MGRDEFVQMACAMNLVPHKNAAARREYIADLKVAAEEMADALGLLAPGPNVASPERPVGWKHGRAQVAELEAELEKATALKTTTPSPRGARA